MMRFAKWVGAGALVGFVALGVAAPEAQAQLSPIYIRNVNLARQGINPNFQVLPGLNIQQALYNTRLYGRAMASIPPYALGYNPYPSPIFSNGPIYNPYNPYPYPPGPFYNPAMAGGGYGSPYGSMYSGPLVGAPAGAGGTATMTSSPYLPSPSGYDISSYSSGGGGYGGGGYGGYGDPYGGYLNGVANVIGATGQYVNSIEQAKMTQERAYQARVDTRRKVIEQLMWEQANKPSYTDVQKKIAKLKLERSQNASPHSIQSGDALNILLDDLRKSPNKKANLPAIPLEEDVLNQVNIAGGKGNLGLLRKTPLNWPMALRDDETKKLRQELDALALLANEDVANGKEVNQGTLKDIRNSLAEMRKRLTEKKDDLATGQFIEAKRFLNSFDDALLALKDGDAAKYRQFKDFVGKGNKSVQDLVEYMTNKGLRFAPAVAGDDAAYQALYSALAAYDLASNAQAVVTTKE